MVQIHGGLGREVRLKSQEQTGKPGARLNSKEARRRADDLQARLQRRLAEMDREAQVSALPPVGMQVERGLGFEPTDRELEKLGYDIESRVVGTGRLRFLEVKGRVSGADIITVTRWF